MSGYVAYALRNFLNKRHVWGKPQTFLTYGGKKAVATASITVGTEATNDIAVTVQLKSSDGSDLEYKGYVSAYLSSDATGDVLEASGPDTIVAGTDGMILPSGGDSVVKFDLKSEVDGDIDLVVTKAGADTFYLNLVMPDGRVVTSGAITFDATT